jgi:hypothetical protein
VGTSKSKILTFVLFLRLMACTIIETGKAKLLTYEVNINRPENMAICLSLHFVSSHHSKGKTFYFTFGLEYGVNLFRSDIRA